jgi:hypothetical protein
MTPAVSLPFMISFRNVQKAVRANAIVKLFVKEGQRRNEGELCALAHGELSEALEYARKGNPPSDHIPNFSGVEEELADTVIRCMDWAEEGGYDLPGAIIAKIAYNATRPAKHGGKLF